MQNMKCAELLYISACSAASHLGIPFDKMVWFQCYRFTLYKSV